jgi:hypothetical protein
MSKLKESIQKNCNKAMTKFCSNSGSYIAYDNREGQIVTISQAGKHCLLCFFSFSY